MAPLKPVATWHLKIRCYTAPFTKPVVIWQYFTKSQNHFYKAQILIWHYFYKAQILIWQLSLHYFIKAKYYFGNSFIKPNTNLTIIFTLFHKVQILFWQVFHKAQILIWQLSLHYFIKPKYYFGNYFIKPECYFGTYLQNQILFWHLFYIY